MTKKEFEIQKALGSLPDNIRWCKECNAATSHAIWNAENKDENGKIRTYEYICLVHDELKCYFIRND